jgi:hypothetical protein
LNDEYELVLATCQLRLRKYKEAETILKRILTRSPENDRALYRLCYCRRATGKFRDAVAGLTKVSDVHRFNGIEYSTQKHF